MTNVHRLDSGTIDRLLSGRMEPDDAPPRYAAVAGLVRALAAPASATELAGEAAAVAAASVVVTARPARERLELTGAARTRTRSRFHRAKVTSLVVVGTLLGTTGLAAAGVLPDSVQDAVHRILSTVGIDVPSAHDEPNGQDGSPVDGGTDQDVQAPDEGGVDDDSDEAHGKSDEAHGKSDEAHGKSDEAHGKSDEAHGKSDEAHGKSDEAHGKSDEAHGKSDEAHGKSDEAHGKSDEAHGKSDEAHGKSDEAHGKSDEAHGNGNGNGNG